MGNIGGWILGGLIAAVGLIALFMAAHADDGLMYYVGLIVFVFAVLFNFGLIHRYTKHEASHSEQH
jgi:membrane protein YdbS with pleckstrin-like domain